MELFLDILLRVTLPIIVIAALGYLLQPWLKLDIGTLTRVQVNVVMPAFLVHFLSAGKQPLDVVWQVATLSVIQFMILIPLGWLLVIVFRLRPSLGPIMGLGTAYANVGFFGIPVTQLAFGPEYLLHQSVLTAMMTILVCTLGVWLLSPGRDSVLAKFRSAFETPLLPSVALGLGLRYFEVELPPVASQPLQLLGAIFTPLALYTLGAQIAAAQSLRFEALPQAIILTLKLLISPLITWGLCRLMGVPDDVTPGDGGGRLDAGRRADHDFRRRVQGRAAVHLDRNRDLDGAVAAIRHRLDHRGAITVTFTQPLPTIGAELPNLPANTISASGFLVRGSRSRAGRSSGRLSGSPWKPSPKPVQMSNSSGTWNVARTLSRSMPAAWCITRPCAVASIAISAAAAPASYHACALG